MRQQTEEREEKTLCLDVVLTGVCRAGHPVGATGSVTLPLTPRGSPPVMRDQGPGSSSVNLGAEGRRGGLGQGAAEDMHCPIFDGEGGGGTEQRWRGRRRHGGGEQAVSRRGRR